MNSASETVSPLYNFNVDDVTELFTRHGFRIDHHRTATITVIDAVGDGLTSSYVQGRGDGIEPAHVTVSKTLTGIDYDTYENVSSYASGLRDRFKTLVMPEGDLDVVKVLEDPGFYNLTAKAAFELLEQAGKKIGVSVTCMFNSTKHSIDEIQRSMDELSKLNPKSL